MPGFFSRATWVLKTVFVAFCATISLPASANGTYQDWWWNPSQSGHGLNVAQQGNSVFVAWFTYDNTGESMWVNFVGNLTNNVVQGDLNLYTGPKLGSPFDASVVKAVKVGTAKLTFNTLSTGVFEWTLSGASGSMNVQRFTWNPIVYAGTYYSQTVGGNKCADGVASYAVSTDSVATFDGTTLRVTDKIGATGAQCTFVGGVTGEGSVIRAVGTYTCNTSAESGAWNSAIQFVTSGSQTVMSRNDTLTRTRGSCVSTQTVVGTTAIQ